MSPVLGCPHLQVMPNFTKPPFMGTPSSPHPTDTLGSPHPHPTPVPRPPTPQPPPPPADAIQPLLHNFPPTLTQMSPLSPTRPHSPNTGAPRGPTWMQWDVPPLPPPFGVPHFCRRAFYGHILCTSTSSQPHAAASLVTALMRSPERPWGGGRAFLGSTLTPFPCTGGIGHHGCVNGFSFPPGSSSQ